MYNNMPLNLSNRILGRESGYRSKSYGIKGLYGDAKFVNDLDIVNELSGHEGCVNALCWSKSGHLLASGSDDTLINIHAYCPENSTSQFKRLTSINTQHKSNIFSVKFMPHSNDATIVSCAGDKQVRVFDINTGSSIAKIFTAHQAAVKKIVTEASPFYFLTCSEDGTVRQWDIRQNQSYYNDKSSRPSPLISYQPYGVELYAMSCSPTQPYYIAVGGTHLHCFLHDRRMMGRDILQERGSKLPISRNPNSITEATKCVTKFAPFGQPEMYRPDSTYITSCKLGLSNPNELIVSWTGDHIYSFNILKSQNESQLESFKMNLSTTSDTSRKRKRATNLESPPHKSAFRDKSENTITDLSIPNTTTSNIVTNLSTNLNTNTHTNPNTNNTTEVRLLYQSNPSSEAHVVSSQFIDNFDDNTKSRSGLVYAQGIRDLKNYISQTHFSHSKKDKDDEMFSILRAAQQAFKPISKFVTDHRLPSYASDYELKLEVDRAKVWRYIQTIGTLARALCDNPTAQSKFALDNFDMIRPAPRELGKNIERYELFGYELCKAILLWLESGVGAVLREFSPESRYYTPASKSRFPCPANSSIDALQSHLIPYLLSLASDLSVEYLNQGTTGDDPRRNYDVFDSEEAAVRSLGRMMEMPFEDLSHDPPKNTSQIFSRQKAAQFWGHKVCIAVFNSASLGINYDFTSDAFSSKYILPKSPNSMKASQPQLINHTTTNVSDSSGNMESTVPVDNPDVSQLSEETRRLIRNNLELLNQLDDSIYEDVEVNLGSEDNESDIDSEELEDEEEEDDDDEDDDDEEEEEEEEEEEIEAESDEALEDRPDLEDTIHERYRDLEEVLEIPDHFTMFRSKKQHFSRGSAGKDVPCSSHVKDYRGHCNIQTTKDVNFFGLQDEYIISGSDEGNLFIWDKKTSKLLNILKGDEEVVNVIQPHPYEPMLAISGIDSTVKIFSPSHYERKIAAKAMTAADPRRFHSIRSRNFRGFEDDDDDDNENYGNDNERGTGNGNGNDQANETKLEDDDDESDVQVIGKGLKSRKRMRDAKHILNLNDQERRTGMQSRYVSSSVLQLMAGQMQFFDLLR